MLVVNYALHELFSKYVQKSKAQKAKFLFPTRSGLKFRNKSSMGSESLNDIPPSLVVLGIYMLTLYQESIFSSFFFFQSLFSRSEFAHVRKNVALSILLHIPIY